MRTKIRTFLLCLLVSGLVINLVNFNVYTDAASITKKIPIPSFTVAYKDLSYEVPESTSKDPYTGETITNPGYHVDNRTLQVTIDNRELVKNYSEWGRISYTARMKGYYESDWNSGSIKRGMADKNFQFTTIVFDSAAGAITFPPGSFVYYHNIPFEGKVDIQVKAQINGMYYNENAIPPESTYFDDALLGESDWSKTQTIVISGSGGQGFNQSQNSQDPVLSPNQSGVHSERTIVGFTLSEFSLIVAVIGLLIAVISMVLLFVYRRKGVVFSLN